MEVDVKDTRHRANSTITSVPAHLSMVSSTLTARQKELRTVDDLAALDKLDEVIQLEFLFNAKHLCHS